MTKQQTDFMKELLGGLNNEITRQAQRNVHPVSEISTLTAQLAEANERCRLLDEKAGDWQHRYTQETMRLQRQLAERDAEIERLKLIEVVYRAIINNTHIAEDERLAKIIELTEQKGKDNGTDLH